MARHRPPAVVAALVSAPLVGLLVSCGGSAEPQAEQSPVATPTGSPFSFTITGPQTAEVGQTVTAELTNTGRLPNRYRLVPDPAGAVTIAEPEVSLGQGESTEISMVVGEVPLIVRVQSVTSGGEADGPYLSIGEQQ